MPQLQYGGSLIKEESMDMRGQCVIQSVNGENGAGTVDKEKAFGHLKNKLLA